MADRLISERAALDAIYTRIEQIGYKHDSSVLSIGQAVRDLPTAQPEPSQIARDIATIIENEQDMRVILAQPQRMRGRWIRHDEWLDDAGQYVYTCSKCDMPIGGRYPYCPNCGADMREGEG